MSSKFRNSKAALLTEAMNTDMAEEYDQDEFTIYDEVGRSRIDRGRVRDDIRWFEIEAKVIGIWYDSPRYETECEYTLYGCVGLSNPKQTVTREIVGIYPVVENVRGRIFSEYKNEGFSDLTASEQADWVISSYPNYGGN